MGLLMHSPRALLIPLVLSQLAILRLFPMCLSTLEYPSPYQVMDATVVNHLANHSMHSALDSII